MYIGNRTRDYGRHPFRPARRSGWEFQAVLEGDIGMLLPTGPELLHSRSLWVFPPMHEHGRTGDPEREAEVAIFHFVGVPSVVANYCRAAPEESLRMAMSRRQCARLRTLADEALRFRKRFCAASLLSAQHILSELSLMVYEACVRDGQPRMQAHDQVCVERALPWYDEHLAEAPDREANARAMGLPPTGRVYRVIKRKAS
jgi:hypothetical protein